MGDTGGQGPQLTFRLGGQKKKAKKGSVMIKCTHGPNFGPSKVRGYVCVGPNLAPRERRLRHRCTIGSSEQASRRRSQSGCNSH